MSFLIHPSMPALLRVSAALSLLLAPALAQAEEACGDSTCDKGYTCQTAPGACPLILCVEGADCAPCEPEEVQYCAPAACDSDADCADYMLCNSYETRECPEETPVCTESDTEEQCSALWAAWEAECTPGEAKECTPRWYLPCEEASDCGPGFECEPYASAGAGSSGSSGSEGSAPAEPAPDAPSAPVSDEPERPAPDPATPPLVPEGTSTPAAGNYCQVIEVACEVDEDCPEHWTCGDNASGSCWSDANGNSGCEPADPARVCAPPEPGNYLVLAASGQPGIAEDSADLGTEVNANDGNAQAPNPEPLPLAGTESGPQASSGGACAVGPALGGSQVNAWGALLGLAGLALSRWRRRAA